MASEPESQDKPKTRAAWVWPLLAAYIAFMVAVGWYLLRDRGTPAPTPDSPQVVAPEGGGPATAVPAGSTIAGQASNPSSPSDPSREDPATRSSPATAVAPPPSFPERPLNRGPSAMTAALNAADKTIAEDVDLLKNVFVSFRTGLKGGNPVGTNREITRALTGRNKMRLVWVDPAHPAINDDGELCDRWGTPFFFHQESAYAMGIRSAGPDREMYTEDDVRFEPKRPGGRRENNPNEPSHPPPR